MKARFIMKIYTILGWHTGASILIWLMTLVVSILLRPIMGDNAKEEDMIPVYVLLYFVFLTLSYLYISAKGYKDAEEDQFSIMKCVFACIIGMVLFGISMH
jgi:hypothetical protein